MASIQAISPTALTDTNTDIELYRFESVTGDGCIRFAVLNADRGSTVGSFSGFIARGHRLFASHD